MSISLRKQIISVASELFMKQGFAATSTRQIAAILNVTQPAIYHHFKNKEEIFLDVISEFALEIGQNLHDILLKKQSKRDCLVEMAVYLKTNHEMNFSLVMHDLQNVISKETDQSIFYIWNENYFRPFTNYFDSIQNYIVPSLNASVASQHFLRILSAYISVSYTNEAINPITITDMVDIFLRGVTGHNFDEIQKKDA